MGKFANSLIKQAQAWIGKNEADGSFEVIIDTYNSHKPLALGYVVKYTDEWCSTFVSAVAIKCGMTDIIPTECGCQRQIELFKKLNSWDENDARIPKPGDVIFYDWNDNGVGNNIGFADHVGIVEKVVGNKVTVIEGNMNGSVGRRTIVVNSKYIRGYGVPKYDVEQDISRVAEAVLAGKYGNGSDRKRRLEAEGYNYQEVQKEVNILVVAKEIIAGKYGNGAERIRKIEAEGYDYNIVQQKVNEMLSK